MKNARILFLSLIALATVCAARGQEGPRLFSISRDGTDLKELAKGFDDALQARLGSHAIGQVRFSPDGSEIVLGVSFNVPPSSPCLGTYSMKPVFNSGKLFLMNRDGSDLHDIALKFNAGAPVFTPNGKKLLFTAFDADTCSGLPKSLGIYSVNLDGTDVALMVAGTTDVSDVNINHDGDKILFTRRNTAVYMSNLDGSDEKLVLYAPAASAIRAVFNPTDPAEITIFGFTFPSLPCCPTFGRIPAATRMLSVNVSTSRRNTVLQGPLGFVVVEANYHPDGKTILYSAITPLGHHLGIYEVAADGTGSRQITNDQLTNDSAHSLAYTADGKSIVFLATSP